MFIKGLSDTVKCRICNRENEKSEVNKLKDIPICIYCGSSLKINKKEAFLEILKVTIIKTNKENRNK